MSSNKQTLPRPEATAFTFRDAGISSELSIVAPDIFRWRAARGATLGPDHSWCVPPGGSGATPAAPGSPVVRMRSELARLEFRRKTLELSFTDAGGLEVFRSVPEAIQFFKTGAQLGFRLADREICLGLGATTGSFNKRGLRRELWNIDVLGHTGAIHPGVRSLYTSIPFLISLREGRAAGLFWDNPARQVWDIGAEVGDVCRVSADVGEVNLYFLLGPTLAAVADQFTRLTGRMPLPPRWALGYHQCRYSYASRAELEEIAREFRERRIPCDALYLDIDHMRGYRTFTFGAKFPKPRQMTDCLAKAGFQIVAIADPGVKEDRRYALWKAGVAGEMFVRTPNGRADYIGKVWPGEVRFPDFTQARVRSWWADEQARFQRQFGIAGLWNDMNEPANFATPNKTLDEACLHGADSAAHRHKELHNVYGLGMAQASREGALRAQPERRPFVLTRAAYAGIQRSAAVWTGDNSSSWEHLEDSIQMLLNLSLSGVAFCGADLGGFLDHCEGELLARWTQLAAFTPYFRNHSDKACRRQEPWTFGPEIERVCRQTIELRYQLWPYLYALFVEAHRTGAPIMRPLAWHFQNDPVAAQCADQFQLGEALLVAPILRRGQAARAVYLPVGEWLDFWTGQRFRGGQHILAHAGLDMIPLFVRAGSIMVLDTVRPHLSGPWPTELTLHIWAGRSGEATYYEDDGVSNDYLLGAAYTRHITYREIGRRRQVRFGPPLGQLHSRVRNWRCVLHDVPEPKHLTLDRQPIPGQYVPEARLLFFEVPAAAAEQEVTIR